MDGSIPDVDGVEHRFIELPGLRMHVAEAVRAIPCCCCTAFHSTGGSGVE